MFKNFGIWNLEIIWSLVFVIWNFDMLSIFISISPKPLDQVSTDTHSRQ
jgi:hypothetical protein